MCVGGEGVGRVCVCVCVCVCGGGDKYKKQYILRNQAFNI